MLKEKNQHLEREVEKLKNMLVVSRLSTLQVRNFLYNITLAANLTPFFQLEKQRALRRRTWGGPALDRVECKDLNLHSGELCVNSYTSRK